MADLPITDLRARELIVALDVPLLEAGESLDSDAAVAAIVADTVKAGLRLTNVSLRINGTYVDAP